MNNLTSAFRQLRNAPAFSFVALMTLALGIGANTAIFSVINGVLLRPLPFEEPERLMRLYERSPNFPKASWAPVSSSRCIRTTLRSRRLPDISREFQPVDGWRRSGAHRRRSGDGGLREGASSESVDGSVLQGR